MKKKGSELVSYFGNDIIALNDDANQKSFSNDRYLRKILTPVELNFIYRNTDDFRLSCLLWTCKECAYKIALKAGFDKNFAPRNYEVIFENLPEDVSQNIYSGTVHFNGKKIFSLSEILPHYISTVACSDESHLKDVKSFTSTTFGSDHSKRAREQLKKTLSVILKIKKSSIEVYKNKEGVPFLNIPDCPELPDISFSHDGIFFSYAFLLNN